MNTMTTYSDDHVITQADAELLISRGACRSGAEESIGYTVRQACQARPANAFRYAASLLTPEQLDRCAEAEPVAALSSAARLLTPERLDQCAGAEPWAALRHAPSLLTLGRLDRCKQTQKLVNTTSTL